MSEAAIDPDQSAEYVLLYPQPHIRNHRPVIAAGLVLGCVCLHALRGSWPTVQPLLHDARGPWNARPHHDAPWEMLILDPPTEGLAVGNNSARLKVRKP